MRFRTIPLTPPRRIVADLSHARLWVPLGVIRRRIDISALREARGTAARPIPWTVLFAKGYALVARDRPELRRSYVRLPWPQLSEASGSIASIMIERDWGGEPALFPAQLKLPAERPLVDLAADLDRALTQPVESIRHFRVLLRLSRWPSPIRALLWWLAFNVGPWRASYYGTFGISVLGQAGAMIDVPVSPLSNFVSYGPFGADGGVDVIMAFDHRVTDGALIAEALAALEQALAGPVADEVRALGVTA